MGTGAFSFSAHKKEMEFVKKAGIFLLVCLSIIFLTACRQKAAASPPAPTPTPVVTPTPEPTPTPLPTPTPPAPVPEVPNTRLPVLMYHEVVPDGGKCSAWMVTATRFREDMQWLADNGYTAVSAGELAAGNPLPERAVLITFDDGYRSNYTLAYPIVVEHRMKAVISLIGHHLDDGDDWFLTWDTCREMLESGFVEFGSHTYDQHTADKCIWRMDGETQLQYGARVFADLQKSIDRMETELGVTVTFLAYPNGRYDEWSDEFIKDRFQVTVSTDFGTADISRGLYKLPRFNINMDDPPARFLPALDA